MLSDEFLTNREAKAGKLGYARRILQAGDDLNIKKRRSEAFGLMARRSERAVP
jgi:hypothetical protein